MAKRKQPDALLTEINQAEGRCAADVMQDPAFLAWVRALRDKFIVNGFLIPLYEISGEYYISKFRVSLYGDYIASWEKQGEVFHEDPKTWIKAEETWFWSFLTEGQVVTYRNKRSKAKLPERYKIKGLPARPVWQEAVKITNQLGLFGEAGGGILMAPEDLDAAHLAKDDIQTEWNEDENGYTEPCNLPLAPRWITKYHLYDQKGASPPLEIRPSWYHLLKYAFYNVPVKRLPVFCAVINADGKIGEIKFQFSDLSAESREYIGTQMFKFPEYVKKHAVSLSIRKHRTSLTWWLWYNIAKKKGEESLTYGQIAARTKELRGTVQMAISRFDRKLKRELDGLFLGQMLRIAATQGFGPNQVYGVLAKKKLVPVRERDIDGFEDFVKLIPTRKCKQNLPLK